MIGIDLREGTCKALRNGNSRFARGDFGCVVVQRRYFQADILLAFRVFVIWGYRVVYTIERKNAVCSGGGVKLTGSYFSMLGSLRINFKLIIRYISIG